jgi:ribosomal protein L19
MGYFTHWSIGSRTMIEKRASPRHRVFKGGTIAFENSGFACTVRNISSGGAAIELDGPVALPQSFTLSIARDNVVRHCRPVWRNDKRVGVAFVQ